MQKVERFYTLDALRGIAAILVVLYHVQPPLGFDPGGYLAVDLFFGLSGIVIAQNYASRISNGLGVLQFLKIRLIRFYPLFLLGNVIGFFWLLIPIILHQRETITLGEDVGALVMSIFMLPSPSSIQPLYPLNGPAWTLLFELLANACYALLLVRCDRRVLIGLMGVLAILLLQVTDPVLGLERGGAWREIPTGLVRTAFSFVAGVLVYETAIKGRVTKASRAFVLPLILAVILLLVDPGERNRSWYDYLCVALVFPLLLMLGARWNASGGLRQACALLGEISYPLYATHYSLILAGSALARRFGWPIALWIPGWIILLVAGSLALSRLFDVPIRRRLTAALR